MGKNYNEWIKSKLMSLILNLCDKEFSTSVSDIKRISIAKKIFK